MKIGFYPGCSLNGTSREYNESVKALAQVMGLELIELKDWNCCGATAAHSMSKQLSLAYLPVCWLWQNNRDFKKSLSPALPVTIV